MVTMGFSDSAADSAADSNFVVSRLPMCLSYNSVRGILVANDQMLNFSTDSHASRVSSNNNAPRNSTTYPVEPMIIHERPDCQLSVGLASPPTSCGRMVFAAPISQRRV